MSSLWWCIMARPLKEYEHGTAARYRLRKCRCDLCKTAAAEERANYRLSPGSKEISYKLRYGSVKVRLDPEPLIAYMTATTLVDHNTLKMFQTWRRYGIDLYRADMYAIKCGTHPYLLWGDAFYQQMEDSK